MQMIFTAALSLTVLVASTDVGTVALAKTQNQSAVDYIKDRFTIERVLDWGSRPVWSPDGKRLVFTRDDQNAGPAYELDLATKKVTCLTCRWGGAGFVARIYYLADGSYLILGLPGKGETALGAKPAKIDMSRTELYWMPPDASLPPQSLGATAFGEIAIDYKTLADGRTRIAWGEFRPKFRMLVGNVGHSGTQAFLTNREVVYDNPSAQAPNVTFTETYDFVDEGKAVTFFTVEKGRADNGMFKISLVDGTISRLPTDGQHNETHIFPDERYALEESNRASDPSSPLKAMSGHLPALLTSILKGSGVPDAEALGQKYGGRKFDLYALDTRTAARRRLTNVSDIGGEASQSSPSPDGRQIVFSLTAPESGAYAGKSGLYVGTFERGK